MTTEEHRHLRLSGRLRRSYEHHTERSWARMLAGLAAGDRRQHGRVI